MDRFGRRCVTIATLAVVAGSVHASSLADSGWCAVSMGHVELMGRIESTRLRQIGVDIERLHGALAVVTRDLDLDFDLPTRVFVFARRDVFRRYARDAGSRAPVAGIFVRTSGKDFILVDASQGHDASMIAYHELLHEFVATNFPTAPLWYAEGLAELFDTFWTNGYRLELGAPNEHYLRTLGRQALMPLDRLFAVSPTSATYSEGARKDLFHAQSWLLVHYLLLGDPERHTRTPAYLAELSRGERPGQAFDAAYPESRSGLLDKLDAYRRRPRLPMMVVDLPEPLPVDVGDVETLPVAEALYRLGDFLARARPDAPHRAERHFRKALDLDPDHAAAREALERLRRRVREPGL